MGPEKPGFVGLTMQARRRARACVHGRDVIVNFGVVQSVGADRFKRMKIISAFRLLSIET